MIITLDDLMGANKEYKNKHSRYERPYYEAQKVNWNNLYQLTDQEIQTQVLQYLNKFGCRINVNQEVIKGIKTAHKKSIPYIDALRNYVLWDIDFNHKTLIYSTSFRLRDIIANIFHNFASVGHRFSHVAASKLLHQINPHIFMMWDNAIIESLNLGKNASDYVEGYLPLMQATLNHLIHQQMILQNISREQVISQLTKVHNKTPLKLLDEYLWVKTRKNTHTRL